MGKTKEEIKFLLNKLQNVPNKDFYFNEKYPKSFCMESNIRGNSNDYYMLIITFF